MTQTDRKKIFNLIKVELKKQRDTWGVQNHHPERWTNILMEELGEASEAILDAYPAHKDYEYNEFNQRLHLNLCKKELIQVAAVAVAAIESLDRNELK